MEVQTHYWDTSDNIRLAWRELGEGRPVILLHAFPVRAEGLKVRRLPSGAGHDGMALRRIADICMLFVRCKDGISHNPAESISAKDAAAGARVLLRFIENFKR